MSFFVVMLQDKQMKYFNNEIHTKKNNVSKVLGKWANLRAHQEDSRPSDLLLQIYFSNTVIYQLSYEKYIFVLDLINKKFHHVHVLLTGKVKLSCDVCKACVVIFPKLTTLRAVVDMELKIVHYFRFFCANIEELQIKTLYEPNEFSDDAYNVMFFKGLCHENVVHRFSNLQEVPLTFKKLKYLSWPILLPKDINFFSNFLFYYRNVDVQWLPTKNCISSYSLFSSAMFYCVDMNPEHSLTHCELIFSDLHLHYVADILIKWKNLESLTLTISFVSNSVKLDRLAKDNLEKIMNGCHKLLKFQLLIAVPGIERCYKIVYAMLEKYGSKLTSLSLVDEPQFLTHKELIKVLNLCRNIQYLYLKGCPTSRYCKNDTLLPFNNLIYFKHLFFGRFTTGRIQVIGKFICDVVKCSPNLTTMLSSFQEYMLNDMLKVTYPQKLSKWTVYLYPTDDMEDLVNKIHQLIKKMNLSELVLESLPQELYFSDAYCMVNPNSPALLMRGNLKNMKIVVRSPQLTYNYQHVAGKDCTS